MATAPNPTSPTELPSPLPEAPKGTALYVHLPFCVTKCHYCDFYSLPAEGQDIPSFMDSLLVEVEQRAPESPGTVFFGGGTPSLLSIPDWQRLMEALDRRTGFRDSAHEISVECNPESLDEDKARALLDLGVNRLSIGMQSLRADTLQQFGRIHSVADAWAAYEAARRAGCTSINLDVIFANPGQTADQWREDLTQVLDRAPDHLAAYNLTFEESTPFLRWLEQGKLVASPEELELELAEITEELTLQAGMPAYEVSNYSRPGYECQHNINYWHNGTYVGVGPSAASKVFHKRGASPRSVARYQRFLRDRGHALEWCEELEPRARLAETWWLGLRLRKGLTPEEARERSGFEEIVDPALPVAQTLLEQDLLTMRDGRFCLSEKGRPLADSIASEFFSACQSENKD
ncbi:MAG: radical SAM family heme chaperone HemW [Planctomycetes bacterium]|nr:radical SAM family heme chaperone HemW [Planctomycetota bacterium]